MRALKTTLLFATIGAGTVLAGCGPDCQTTCQRLYGDEPNCDLKSPGATRDELLSQCDDECSTGLENPGEVGNYNPKEYTPQSESVELETDRQVALWMECIKETSCKLLDEGYCAPVW